MKFRIAHILREDSGQALTEYILVTAVGVLAITAVLILWKVPLASYLHRLAEIIARTR